MEKPYVPFYIKKDGEITEGDEGKSFQRYSLHVGLNAPPLCVDEGAFEVDDIGKVIKTVERMFMIHTTGLNGHGCNASEAYIANKVNKDGFALLHACKSSPTKDSMVEFYTESVPKPYLDLVHFIGSVEVMIATVRHIFDNHNIDLSSMDDLPKLFRKKYIEFANSSNANSDFINRKSLLVEKRFKKYPIPIDWP